MSAFPLLLSLSLLAGASPRFALLRTGDFHGDEVPANAEGTWLGLFERELRPVRVEIRTVRDILVDEDDVRTGRHVAVAEGGEPRVLLRGLRAGPVTAITVDGHALSSPGDFQLPLGGAVFHLVHQARGAVVRLLLRRGPVEQTLFEMADGVTDSWHLRWAGDLDGDGKLDLVLSASSHYNVDVLRLFLSSQAGRGELVREVASLRTTGC